MRKYIVILCLFVNAVFGQHAPFHPLNTATVAWTHTLSTYPAPATVYAVNPFIQAEKNNGNWDLVDRYWLLAQDIQNNTYVDLKNPGSSVRLSSVNLPTFTANQGFTGNGSNMYLNTAYSNTTTVNYTYTLSSYGFWQRNSVTEVAIDMGCSNGATEFCQIASGHTTAGFLERLNSDATFVNLANTSSIGLFVAQRSGATNSSGYYNGALYMTGANAATATPSFPFYILTGDASGSVANPSTAQLSFAFIGSGNINQANLYSDVLILKNKIGF